jgi:hypothetical protein
MAELHKDTNDKFAQYGILLLAVVLKENPGYKQSDIFKLFKASMSKYKVEHGIQPLLEFLNQ